MRYGRALDALIGLNGPDESLLGSYSHTLPIFHSEEQKMVSGSSNSLYSPSAKRELI